MFILPDEALLIGRYSPDSTFRHNVRDTMSLASIGFNISCSLVPSQSVAPHNIDDLLRVGQSEMDRDAGEVRKDILEMQHESEGGQCSTEQEVTQVECPPNEPPCAPEPTATSGGGKRCCVVL